MDSWIESLKGSKWPINLSNIDAASFAAKLDNLNAGPLVLSEFETEPVTISRQIQSSQGFFHTLHLLQKGSVRIHHNNKITLLMPGESILADSSKPSFLEFIDKSRVLGVRIPTALLSQYINNPGSHANSKVSDKDLNAVLKSMFKCLWKHALAGSYNEACNIRIKAFLSLVRASIESTQLTVSTPNSELISLIKSYINNHLPDQDMNQSSVALHFRISTRYLRKLFLADPIGSPSRFIRIQRLNKFMAELVANATAGSDTITSLALSNGFRSVGSLNRTFKEINGVSPSTFLQRCKCHDPEPVATRHAERLERAPLRT
jgi:AraC-like DNA-binding protein